MHHELNDDGRIALAKQSPSVFSALVLEMTQSRMHMDLQRHLSAHVDAYVELPRGHGKTTQSAARVAWEVGRNPNIRVKYVQHVKDKASETVRYIRHIIESDLYREVFPEIEPDEENWGSESFTVKRPRAVRDPSVQAEGINGRAGGRFDLIIADDICDIQNAIQKPMEREKVKEAWTTNWLPMADYARGRPRSWKFATPYHVSDITADWRDYHQRDQSMLRMPVVDYCSPWSDVWTRKVLEAERSKMGPIAFGRAYELVPVSSEMIIFPAEWLDSAMVMEVPHDQARRGEMIASFDFAYTEKSNRNTDPDWSVCLVGWKSSVNHVFAVDMLRERIPFPEFKRRSIEMCVRHGVKRGIADSTGPQSGIVQQLNQDAPFPVRPRNRINDNLIMATEKQDFVEQGRFHILGCRDNVGRLVPVKALEPLYTEMTTFPAGEHDDCVAAAIDMMDMIVHPSSLGQGDIVRVQTGNLARGLYGIN